MVDQPDFPGPGEYIGPDNIQAEPNAANVPDGEMPGVDPLHDQRRRTLEMQPVVLRESNDLVEMARQRNLRRTGTERDALPRIRLRADATEQRRDGSTHDDQRENVFDPVQDDSGPQSDQS